MRIDTYGAVSDAVEEGSMSSTGRIGVRRADDDYATPAWCVRAIAPQLGLGNLEAILDPCAGEGLLLDAIWGWYIDSFVTVERNFYGIELNEPRAMACNRPGSVHCEWRDALQADPWPRADLIITNPPFSLAMEFVERALREVVPGGDVVMLLRLAWLASKKRAEFHRRHPSDVFVLPKRPSFTANGKTDSADYAWFVWGPGRGNRWHILDAKA